MKGLSTEIFYNRLNKYKLIATVNTPAQIDQAIKYKEHIGAVTLVTGNILSLKKYVDVLQKEDIPVIINIEKIEGLKIDNYGVDFIIDYIKPFGILSTKRNVIKRAKAKGIFVVQMVFLYDTHSYKNLTDNINTLNVDLIEIMPCRAFDILENIVSISPVPVIAGGLVTDTALAKEVLDTGAASVSTTNVSIWKEGLS